MTHKITTQQISDLKRLTIGCAKCKGFKGNPFQNQIIKILMEIEKQ
jgi:hypothetical protein